MRGTPDLKSVSDDKLLLGLFEILKRTRHDEAELVAHIAEVDARRLYLREAAPSMFAYCTEVLHLSEPEAALRIRVARLSRKHPMVLAMLGDGRLHLSGFALLAPVLTRENRRSLLKRTTHKSKREIQEIVAELTPRPDVPGTMRRLPTPREPEVSASAAPPLRPGPATVPSGKAGQENWASDPPLGPSAAMISVSEQRPDAVAFASRCDKETSPAGQGQDVAASADPAGASAPSSRPLPRLQPARLATVEPLAPARYSVRFTASAELRDKLERLQALMRQSVPDGDLATIIDVAVTRELERLEAKRFAKTRNPRQHLGRVDATPKTRHIPAAVRRAVHERDESRCTYRDKSGRRCTKRHDLEFHHRQPFGQGGDHSAKNLALVCRAHNALMAEQDFGKEVMARHRRRASHDRGTGPAGVAGAGPVGAGAARCGPTDREIVGGGPGPSGLRARSP
jgi:hypothetical protein